MMKIVAALLLVAQPVLPTYFQPHGETFQPKPFQYQYGLAGERLPSFSKKEKQDSAGNVEGEYSVVLPDGRVMVVTYNADHYEGFFSKVDYQGEPTKEVQGNIQDGYQEANKQIIPTQLSSPVVPFRPISLPKLVPFTVKPKLPSLFMKQASLKNTKPASSPVPIYNPKSPQQKTRPQSKNKRVHLPTYFRPVRNSFQPITASGGIQPITASERNQVITPSATVSPKEIVLIGNKLKQYLPKMKGRSAKVPKIGKFENEENTNIDSDSKIEENKMFEIMKNIRKLITG